MNPENEKFENSLASIASETFRFQRVFEKAIGKLDVEDQSKYMSQFAWFSKKVIKALEEANIRILNLEGSTYDPGMSVIPLNLDDFDVDTSLYIVQMIEPIIMHGDTVKKVGTVILGRVES